MLIKLKPSSIVISLLFSVTTTTILHTQTTLLDEIPIWILGLVTLTTLTLKVLFGAYFIENIPKAFAKWEAQKEAFPGKWRTTQKKIQEILSIWKE